MAEAFVIVGASLAGGTAAATLREEGFDGRVVLIGEESAAPYERPPLSKEYLRGEVPFSDALVHPEDFYASNDIDLGQLMAGEGVCLRIDIGLDAKPGDYSQNVAQGDDSTFDLRFDLKQVLPAV